MFYGIYPRQESLRLYRNLLSLDNREIISHYGSFVNMFFEKYFIFLKFIFRLTYQADRSCFG